MKLKLNMSRVYACSRYSVCIFFGGLLIVDGGSKVLNVIPSTCGSCSKYISTKWLVLVSLQALSESPNVASCPLQQSRAHQELTLSLLCLRAVDAKNECPCPALPATQLPAVDLRGTYCSNVASPRDNVSQTHINFENARLSPPSPQPSFEQSERAAHPPGMLAKVLQIEIQRSREVPWIR